MGAEAMHVIRAKKQEKSTYVQAYGLANCPIRGRCVVAKAGWAAMGWSQALVSGVKVNPIILFTGGPMREGHGMPTVVVIPHSGVICLDETGEDIIINLDRTSPGSGTLFTTALRHLEDGTRESVGKAAHRLVDDKIGYPTRLQNCQSIGSSAGDSALFMEPVDIDSLEPVYVSTVKDSSGNLHTTAWLVGIYGLREGGVGPPINPMQETRPTIMSVRNGIIVLPRREARIVTKLMISFICDRLNSLSAEEETMRARLRANLDWFENRFPVLVKAPPQDAEKPASSTFAQRVKAIIKPRQGKHT
ncbi:hypothetical protein MMC11_006573 [Xylographa trunciseda]|nr:hypothetical protein [Xylographa trunciseda]